MFQRCLDDTCSLIPWLILNLWVFTLNSCLEVPTISQFFLIRTFGTWRHLNVGVKDANTLCFSASFKFSNIVWEHAILFSCNIGHECENTFFLTIILWHKESGEFLNWHSNELHNQIRYGSICILLMPICGSSLYMGPCLTHQSSGYLLHLTIVTNNHLCKNELKYLEIGF